MNPQADVNRLPHPETIDVGRSDLHEVLDFRPNEGIISLHEQRGVIVSAAAMPGFSSVPIVVIRLDSVGQSAGQRPRLRSDVQRRELTV